MNDGKTLEFVSAEYFCSFKLLTIFLLVVFDQNRKLSSYFGTARRKSIICEICHPFRGIFNHLGDVSCELFPASFAQYVGLFKFNEDLINYYTDLVRTS